MESLIVDIVKEALKSGCGVVAAMLCLSLVVNYRFYKKLMTYLERDKVKSERWIQKYAELSFELKGLSQDLTKKLYSRDEKGRRGD